MMLAFMWKPRFSIRRVDSVDCDVVQYASAFSTFGFFTYTRIKLKCGIQCLKLFSNPCSSQRLLSHNKYLCSKVLLLIFKCFFPIFVVIHTSLSAIFFCSTFSAFEPPRFLVEV